jgi:hypothetical protein
MDADADNMKNNALPPKGASATTVSKTNANGNPPPPRKGEKNRPTMRSEERRRKERKTDDNDDDEKQKNKALSPNPDKAPLNAENGRKGSNASTYKPAKPKEEPT